MRGNDVLGNLRIASPCDQKWEDMTGDERVRLCEKCALHVYNFENMTSDDVVALVTKTEGRVCGRFWRRTDGKIVTSDCPVAFDRLKRRAGMAAAVLASFATMAIGACLVIVRGKDAPAIDLTQIAPVAKVCNWAKGPQPMPMAGELAYLPPQTPVPVATPLVQLGTKKAKAKTP